MYATTSVDRMAKSKQVKDKFRVTSSVQKSAEVCGLRTETKIWFDAPPFEFPEDYLALFAELSEPIRERANFYRTYNMADWKAPSARTYSSPKTWLRTRKDDASRSLFVREARATADAAISGVDTSFHGNRSAAWARNADYIRQILPSADLQQSPAEFIARAINICERVPFASGHIGFALELSPLLGTALQAEGQRAAYALSTRHPGATIGGSLEARALRATKGVAGVSWLTLVGSTPLETLGGRDAVREALAATPEVVVHEARHGLVVQAGPAAALGDVNKGENLPTHRAVFAALSPAIEPLSEHVRCLRLGGDDDHDRTIAWHRRFR